MTLSTPTSPSPKPVHTLLDVAATFIHSAIKVISNSEILGPIVIQHLKAIAETQRVTDSLQLLEELLPKNLVMYPRQQAVM